MRKILVVARHNPAEALRVAAGLTLLSDPVRVVVPGPLEDSPAVAEQKEVLEFAEVPCDELHGTPDPVSALAEAILDSTHVYVI